MNEWNLNDFEMINIYSQTKWDYRGGLTAQQQLKATCIDGLG